MKAPSIASPAATASRAALLPRHIRKPGIPLRTVRTAARKQDTQEQSSQQASSYSLTRQRAACR